ncbi:exported hypothetical protein [Agrobacterium genomosp. 5 str. CFBP 6626]|nr:exported hypothetical protein [Agrobacterium genomosp. 5 str. CFBP 6626]
MEQRLNTFSPCAASPSAKAVEERQRKKANKAGRDLGAGIVMTCIIQRPPRLTTKRALFDMRQNARCNTPGALAD